MLARVAQNGQVDITSLFAAWLIWQVTEHVQKGVGHCADYTFTEAPLLCIRLQKHPCYAEDTFTECYAYVHRSTPVMHGTRELALQNGCGAISHGHAHTGQ